MEGPRVVTHAYIEFLALAVAYATLTEWAEEEARRQEDERQERGEEE